MTYEGKLNIDGERFSREKDRYVRGDDMEHTSCGNCEHDISGITFCPLHAAAPALLEALEWYARDYPGGERARAAIKAAKGD